MSGAFLAIPAAALAVTLAAATPDGAALTQLGMAGDWAIDCQKPVADDNPRVSFAVADGQAPQYIERGPGGSQGTAVISEVRALSGGQIAMTMTITDTLGGAGRQVVMNNVLVKTGDKFRFLEAKAAAGPAEISGGVIQASGAPTKWLQKCGG